MVSFWDPATGKLITTLHDPGRQSSVNSIAFSANGTVLATGDYNGRTYLWDPATGKLITTLHDPGRQAHVNGIAFSPEGTILATADNNGAIYLWSIVTDKQIATLSGLSNMPISSVAFSPDGKTLAAGEGDSALLWNAASHKRIAKSPQERGFVRTVTFSPDGKTLAFVDGYNDGAGNAYLWTITAGRSIITVHDPAGYSIDAIAFSPDGKILATGDNVELFQPISSTARTYLWNVHELS